MQQCNMGLIQMSYYLDWNHYWQHIFIVSILKKFRGFSLHSNRIQEIRSFFFNLKIFNLFHKILSLLFRKRSLLEFFWKKLSRVPYGTHIQKWVSNNNPFARTNWDLSNTILYACNAIRFNSVWTERKHNLFQYRLWWRRFFSVLQGSN